MAGMFGEAINCRDDFLLQLAQAQRDVSALVELLPYEAPLKAVENQLASIAKWTAHGRTPTVQELHRHLFQVLARRENRR